MFFSFLMRCDWRSIHLIGFLYASLMLGMALYFQLVDFILPCRICVYLRALTLLYALISLMAVFHHPKRWGKKIYRILLAFYSLSGVMLSFYLLTSQHYSFSAPLSCEQGSVEKFSSWFLGDLLTTLFTYYGNCERAEITGLGISLASLSLISFSLLLIWEGMKVRLK